MPQLSVIVEQCLAPVPGGTGRYAAQITAALAARPRPGWTVRPVTAWHRDVRAATFHGAIRPARLPAGHRVLNELWFRGLPPWPGGAAVHATTPLAPARRDGMVVTVHDAVPWTHPETLSPRGVKWHRVMVGRAMDRARAVVVPSIAVADDLAGVFPAAAQRLVVVGHGATELPVPPDAASRRRRLGLPDGYVLAIGTLEPRKGLDVLIDAMARQAMAGTHLALVGPAGWGGVDVSRLAARAGLPAGRLHGLGRLDDADLAAVLAGARVLAAPSRSEGFGLPVLEAMAAGVPVLCSDAPALVELTAGSAVVVPREDPVALADALRDLLADPTAAGALAGRGRARAAAFTWSAAAEQLWNLHAGPSAPAPADPDDLAGNGA